MPTNATQSSAPSPYDWGEHLIWLEGGTVDDNAPDEVVLKAWKGLMLVVGIAVICFTARSIASALGWPHSKLIDPILFSMLVGILVGNIYRSENLRSGINIAVRKILPCGVILLGARMNMLDAISIGLPGLILSVLVVCMALALFYVCSRYLELDKELACLLGIGTGICGGTAIVAVAPILSAKERNVTLGVAIVTMVGLLGMLTLPLIATVLQMTQSQFGMLAGLTIHQTPQVIASGFGYGDEAGQVATVTKLTRVCLLAPIAIGLGWWIAHKHQSSKVKRRRWYKLFPGFALSFIAMTAFSSLGLLPSVEMSWSPAFNSGTTELAFDTTATLKLGSTFCLAVGMAGVGFQTRFADFKSVGVKPIVLAVCVSTSMVGVATIIITSLFS